VKMLTKVEEFLRQKMLNFVKQEAEIRKNLELKGAMNDLVLLPLLMMIQ